MHMSSSSADITILEGDKTFLANKLWERLNPDKWPLNCHELPHGSALVGGAVRDGLLDRLGERQDLDFLVPKQAVKLAKHLARKLDGRCVVLDLDRDIARLIIGDWTIDLASQIGQSLEEDLFRRDFRINSIALTIEPNPKICDPTGGIADLRKRSVVAVKEKNLIDDPLRLLRGLRFMAELQFSLDTPTKNFIQEHSSLLQRVAHERIQSELLKIVNFKLADQVIIYLKTFNLLGPWKNKEEVLRRKAPTFDDAKILNSTELSFALPIARLTHLLSDFGLQQLKFSRRDRKSCNLLRKWLERKEGNDFQHLKEFDRLQLHIDLELGLPALILELPNAQQKAWLNRWRDKNDPLFHPSSPLDGNTLKEMLDVPEGPALGELLRHLCHERAFGRIDTEEQAIYAARCWLKQNKTFL